MSRKRSAHELVEHASYRGVEHASYLKGLLKPFKGKGDLEDLERQLLDVQRGVSDLMDQVVDMWGRPLLSFTVGHATATFFLWFKSLAMAIQGPWGKNGRWGLEQRNAFQKDAGGSAG